jgi:hypothetical protein
MMTADIEPIARRGMTWLIARAAELSPGWTATHWARPDRRIVAPAEVAIGALLAARFGGLPTSAARLRGALRDSCLPELLDEFDRHPALWFRPLLATAGAFRAVGDPWNDGEALLRERLAGAMSDPASLRLDQVLEVRHWLRQLDLLPHGIDVDLSDIAGQELMRLSTPMADGPVDRDTAYVITHLVYYGWGFGSTSASVPGVQMTMERIATRAALLGDVDLLAEAIIAARTLNNRLPTVIPSAMSIFAVAQRPSGALRPNLIPSVIKREMETELCYHSTIVASVAAGIVAQWTTTD